MIESALRPRAGEGGPTKSGRMRDLATQYEFIRLSLTIALSRFNAAPEPDRLRSSAGPKWRKLCAPSHADFPINRSSPSQCARPSSGLYKVLAIPLQTAPSTPIISKDDFLRFREFFYGKTEDLSSEGSLLGSVIDSTGLLELVTFMQEHFGITVDDEDKIAEALSRVLTEDAFRSAAQAVAEVKRVVVVNGRSERRSP